VKKQLSRNQIVMVLIGLGTCCVLAFQNCSKGAETKVIASNEAILSECEADDSCSSSASTQDPKDSQNNSGAGNTDPNSGTIDPKLLFNFVAPTQEACDSAVKSRLGKAVACTFGGACGETCGRPSPTCVSTGLTTYGACLDSQGKFECKKAGTMIAFQNCGTITQPSSEVQTAPQSLTGCCSEKIYRVCAVSGNNIANSITCQ
jgi:hypothetical protein